MAPEDESRWDAGLGGLEVSCATSLVTGHTNGGLEGAAAPPGFGGCRLAAYMCPMHLVCGP